MGAFDLGGPPTGTTFAIYHVSAFTFQRATRDQNSAGELVLSFTDALSVTGELIPAVGAILRATYGTVNQVDATLYLEGNVDVRVADRVTVSATLIEVVNVRHYGVDATEAWLKYVR